MTLTSDTMLGLAWYTFATCCSRHILSSTILTLKFYNQGLYNCFTKVGFVIMVWTSLESILGLCCKTCGCNISGFAFVRGMLVRSENRWLYRDVTRQTKNCSVWSAFKLMLPLWWWFTHLSRDNLGGSATAGIRAASIHQRCWNLKNRFPFKIGTTKNFGKLRWIR